MGITFHSLERLQAMQLLPRRSSILDIGSSNLYSASSGQLRNFLSWYGADADLRDAEGFLDRLADGSQYGPNGTANRSFVGELLERAGLRYLAFDIADGYRTEIFDLNRRQLDADKRHAFDTALNFGTTEHLLNQLNAFRVIHDAVRPGGHMVHSLPTLGYVDHGYITYTPRFFFDLCGYNDYELVHFEYQGPGQNRDIFEIVRNYANYFPSLHAAVNAAKKGPLENIAPADVGSFVVFRKKSDRPFCVPMETSTSVGSVDLSDTAPIMESVASLPTRHLYQLGFTLLAAALRKTPGTLVRAGKRLLGT
jgi:SAM-dependent methyltransferase